LHWWGAIALSPSPLPYIPHERAEHDLIHTVLIERLYGRSGILVLPVTNNLKITTTNSLKMLASELKY